MKAERKWENDVTTDRCSQLKNRLKSKAAVKYEFSIGALKAFYSIFWADILLACIPRNAVSENKKNRPPKFHRSAPLTALSTLVTLFRGLWLGCSPLVVGQHIPDGWRHCYWRELTPRTLLQTCIFLRNIKLFRSTVVRQCDNEFDGTKLTQLSSNTIFFTIYFVRGLLFNHFPPGKI